MRNNSRVLICSFAVATFRWYVINGLAVLPLITCNHVDRLLKQIEIEIGVSCCRWRKVVVAIYKTLAASVKQCVYVSLVPACLLHWLKFTVKIV